MRVYFSTYHLWAARHFAQMARDFEDAHSGRSRFDPLHRSYAVGAILSCVSFLEAMVNEILKDVYDDHLSYVGSIPVNNRLLLYRYWDEKGDREGVFEKYNTALRLCDKEQFANGARPFQDALLVNRIRNVLIHFKPDTAFADDPTKLEKQLIGKFEPAKHMADSGNPFFPDKAWCAEWAVHSSRGLADEFCLRLGIEPNYQRVIDRL
jgi:hypothetical protein